MIEVTRYVASDGKEFAKREECIEYENTLEIREAIKKISTHCLITFCEECPFYLKDNIDNCFFTNSLPSNWENYL